MTITFGELGGTAPDSQTGTGRAVVRFAARGLGFSLMPGQGVGRARFDGFVATAAGPAPPPPPVFVTGRARFSLVAAGTGNKTVHGSGGARFRLRALGYGVPNHGRAGIEFQFAATAAAPGQQDPPEDPVDIASVTERVGLAAAMASSETAVMREVLAVRGAIASRLEGRVRVAETLAFDDALAMVYYELVLEGFAFDAPLTEQRQALERVVERLLLSGTVSSVLDAVDSLIVTVALATAAELPLFDSITEEVALEAALGSHALAVARALETLALGDTLGSDFTATVLIREGIGLAGELGAAAELHQLITEAVGFVAALTLDSGEYIAWVLNTESKGLSTYDNYPFNSFARVGNRYYGCAADGIHRLEGTTDNGEPINWRLRTGLTDMGTRKLKRIPECFLMLATDGTIYVQAIVVDEQGDKAAAIYRMKERPGANRRENRQKLGKGLKSIDWAFVLEPVDGSTLDLGSMELHPMILDRRTRG